MTPRAITGFGVVSPVGIGREAFINGLLSSTRPVRKSGQIEAANFDPTVYLGDKGLRSLDRFTKLLLVAARLALVDAGLKKDGVWTALSPEKVGIVSSNAYGSLEATVEIDRVVTLEDARYINPSRFPLTVSNSAAGYASIWEELRALNVSVSDGNCGALDAMACADSMLEQGRASALLVGGAEAASEALLLGFQKLGAVGDRAALGEGAALLMLEPISGARARGAMMHGEILGYGTAFEPPHRETALLYATPDALERAITDALSDAEMFSSDIDVVVSGVSGMRAFDEAEICGIARSLGEATPILAPKFAFGETLGAGGALGMTSAIALFGSASRNIGADLWVRGSLRTSPRTALVTTVGYYGNASALVMRAGPR